MDPSKLNVKAAGKGKAAETKPGVENHLESQPVHVTQSGYHGNVQCEEEFTAKDLLRFAWQIARGMVGDELRNRKFPKYLKLYRVKGPVIARLQMLLSETEDATIKYNHFLFKL